LISNKQQTKEKENEEMEKIQIINAGKELADVTYKKDGKIVPLATKKTRTVGVNQEVMSKSFMAACESVPVEQEALIPDSVSDVYNELRKEIDAKNAPAAAPEAEVKTEPAPVVKEPAAKKAGAPAGARAKTGVTLEFLTKLVETGKHTAKEIVAKAVTELETKESSVATLLSDGKNVKYNKFAKLIVVGEGGKLSFK
jgi:hypothetical protein